MRVLKLKEHRRSLGLSQREMAKKLNISQPYYWSWENGNNFPDAKQILQLCEIFDVTPNDLFGIKGVHRVAIEKTR